MSDPTKWGVTSADALAGAERVAAIVRTGGMLAGNWEGGYRRPDGTYMTHIPWVGWVVDRPPPFIRAAPKRRMSWWRRFLPPWRRP